MAKTVMKDHDARDRMKLLRLWDFTCVLCGHGFRDIASVSCEHIVPKSMGGPKNKGNRKHRAMGNLGPSHWRCNNFRGCMGMLETARLLDVVRREVGDEAFETWINQDVPHRVVPDCFMALHVGGPLV